MKKIEMSQEELASWASQFTGPRDEIYYADGFLFIPDSQYNAAKAVDTSAQPQLPVPDRISDRQFFQQMAIEGKLTEAEALAAVATGTIPAAMDGLIDQLPQAQRFPARMLVSGATEFLRQHPVTQLIGQLYGYSSADIDRIWIEGEAL